MLDAMSSNSNDSNIPVVADANTPSVSHEDGMMKTSLASGKESVPQSRLVIRVIGNLGKLKNEYSEIIEVDFIDPRMEGGKYPINDLGMGRLYADTYRNFLRYVRESKNWFYYHGGVWREDVGGIYARQAAKVLILYLQRMDPLSDDYCSYSYRSKRETMIKEAQDFYSLSLSDFDTDPKLFNCQNVTINLETGEARSHNPADLLSKKANVIYDPDSKCVRWDEFIDEIMLKDKELALFLQKCFGYGLSGDISQECLFILYGPSTRNGKGTLMESIYNLFSDYAKAIQPGTLANRKANGSGHSDDIAQLAGIRFVNCSELPQDMKLNSALVKQFTGGDTVMARRIYQGFFEFLPQFIIVINTNYLPSIDDDTLLSSGRLILIPFDRHFTKDEQDPDLKKFFREDENKSAILNWLLEGYKRYKADADRLTMPAKAMELLHEYRKNNDGVGLYIEECLASCDTSITENRKRASEFYKDFKLWRSDSIAEVSQKEFVRAIRHKNLLGRDRNLGHYIKDYTFKCNE